MARKRMFSLDVIDTDIFVEMPQTTRLLYYELCMRADDDGFVGSPKKIQRMVGCSDDDMKILITKQFIIAFASGIIVIRHWRIHNIIQKDRYKETLYIAEKQQLTQNETAVYDLYTECIQNVSKVDTQISIDKISIDKIRPVAEDIYNKAQKEKRDSAGAIFKFWNENIGLITPYQAEILNSYTELTEELILEVVKEAVSNNAKNIKYIKAILDRCLQNKIYTVEQFKASQVEFNNKKQGNRICTEETEEQKAERRKKLADEVRRLNAKEEAE